LKTIYISDANFAVSATSVQNSPSPDIAEVAFMGRSNVGKSSLLNSLTNRRNLAKSSSTPGKTKLINFFDINLRVREDEEKLKYPCRFIDLPGFGYAKVSKSLKKDWGENLTNFLQNRDSIRVFIHLRDARHPDLGIDNNVHEFITHIKNPDQIIIDVFTKIDKLKQNDLTKLKRAFPDALFVSNLKNRGFDKVNGAIYEYLFGVSNLSSTN
jgi:GTP-binding protein